MNTIWENLPEALRVGGPEKNMLHRLCGEEGGARTTNEGAKT